MLKRMLMWCMVVAFGFTMVGCATTGKTVPVGCEKSVIYNNVPNADLAGGLISVAGMTGFKALKQKGVDMAPVVSCLQQLDGILDKEGLTYTQFVAALANANSYIKNYAGIELVFLTNLVDTMFREQVTIDACDRKFLDRTIKDILTNINLA